MSQSVDQAKKIKHVVLLVHGIQDFGTKWMRSVTKSLESEDTKVVGTSFGFFDVVRFLSPFDFSKRPISLIEQSIKNAKRNYGGDNFVPDISVICHSFGTYVVTKLLEKDPSLRLKNLILCGSVVDEHFKWEKIAHQIGDVADPDKTKCIINDCAEDDHWPALGKAAGWRYGKGGVDGFMSPFVRDRFHKGDHGVFLKPEFAERYWRPIIHGEPNLDDEVLLGSGTPESLPKWIRYLAALPLNWILLAIKLLLLTFIGYLGFLGINSCLKVNAPTKMTIIDENSGSVIERDFELTYTTNGRDFETTEGDDGVCFIPKTHVQNSSFQITDVSCFVGERESDSEPQQLHAFGLPIEMKRGKSLEIDDTFRFAKLTLERTYDYTKEIGPGSGIHNCPEEGRPSIEEYRLGFAPHPEFTQEDIQLTCKSTTEHKIDIFFQHYYLKDINAEFNAKYEGLPVPLHVLGVSKHNTPPPFSKFNFKPGFYFVWVSEYGKKAEYIKLVDLYNRPDNVLIFQKSKDGYDFEFEEEDD